MDCKLYIRVQYFIFPFIAVKFSVLFCPFIVTQEKEEFLEDFCLSLMVTQGKIRIIGSVLCYFNLFYFLRSYGDPKEMKGS